MTPAPRVLIVDDQVGDITWLIDLIQDRGYVVVVATNEEAARKQLEAVRQGQASYALAIIDVMVAVKDLMDLATLDDDTFEVSRDTGIRLCKYARRDLGLSERDLLIACLTVRDDNDVKAAMRDLGIPLFNRAPYGPEDSIGDFVEAHLPVVEDRGEPG
jgi:CheY-like chemotaxis protein